MSKLILASASPRRKELLEQIGLSFDIFPVDINEMPFRDERAEDYVDRMAREKAECAWQSYQQTKSGSNGERCIVLAADTGVVLDDHIFGKPIDFADFKRMMKLMSGEQHHVITSVNIIESRAGMTNKMATRVISKVKFKPLNDAEIDAYWQTREPIDKAGGYGIQGRGAILVEGIEGSYSGIVGLPLRETAELLVQLGIDVWTTRPISENQ